MAPGVEDSKQRLRPPARVLVVASVLALAAWVRFAVLPAILIDGVLVPGDGDSEYHLRTILRAADSFPRLSVMDPLLGWPRGHAHHWAPGFDWVGAAWTLLVSSLGVPRPWAAATFPVLLGVGTVFAAMRLARALLPTGASPLWPALAGLSLALSPQFIGTSRFGRVDHHVWEALSVVLLAQWATHSLQRAAPRRVEWVGAVVVAATLAGFIGGPLYLALVTASLVLATLLARQPPPLWGSGAFGLAVGGVLAALINLGPMREHGHLWHYGFPSLLQPALALVAATGLALANVAARWRARTSRRLTPWLLGAGALGVALVLLPGLGDELRAGLVGWVARRDPWLASISEFQPFFVVGGGPVRAVSYAFGFVGFVTVPALLFVALQRRREPIVAAWAFVAISLVGLTLLQARFGRVLAPHLGIALTLAVAGLERRRLQAVAVSVLLVLLAVDPEVHRKVVLADARTLPPLAAMADGLRLDRPPTPGNSDGVLASWELGSTLLSRSGRPVIACGFGSFVDPEGFALSADAFSAGEARLLEVMSERDLGFVVGGAMVELKVDPTLIRDGALAVDRLERRPVMALLQGGSGIPGRVPHLEHLMPLAATREHLAAAHSALPALWTFQRVAGVVVEAPCGSDDLAVLTLEARLGDRPGAFTAWAACKGEPTASLRLAVPSGVRRPGFETAPAWAGHDGSRFELSETELRPR